MADKNEVYMNGDYAESGVTVMQGAVESITRGEIDIQIATAHRYPRSIKKFNEEALTMATINEETAESCFYVLPRAEKNIEGPSIRLMEIAASAWGNIRYGSRTIGEDNEFVTSQGIAHDLERNVSVTVEVRRRITNKRKEKFNSDMIAVTANAAGSIARRNALLGVIPRAYITPIYEQAKQVAVGTQQTLAQKRENALLFFAKKGVSGARVFKKLEVNGKEDITLTHLEILVGLKTAIRENETSIDTEFPEETPLVTGTQSVLDKIRGNEPQGQPLPISEPFSHPTEVVHDPESPSATHTGTTEGNTAEQSHEAPKRGVGRPPITKMTPSANTEEKVTESSVLKAQDDLPELPDDGLFPSNMR